VIRSFSATFIILLATGSGIAAFAQAQPVASSNNMFPQWSQDGRRLAFTSDRDGDPELYVMNADGSDPKRLTRMNGRDAHPYFSKDGKRIVFQSPRANRVDTSNT
jgi:TolB protein